MAVSQYAKAAIPEPVQILGLKLKPFSLGHFLLMERFDCAFVAEEVRDAKLDDLVMGVLICSMDYEEFLAFIQRKDFLKEVKKWGVKAAAKSKSNGLFGFDVGAKIRLFNNYILAATVQPVVIFEHDAGTSGAHWSQALKLTLTGALGYTAHEALNLPLSQAFADFYKHAENTGAVTIADDKTAEMLAAADLAAASKTGLHPDIEEFLTSPTPKVPAQPQADPANPDEPKGGA